MKRSTAGQYYMFGPFVDSTDGVTPETGLTINASDIRLSKNGGAFAAKNSGGATHVENGWYQIGFDSTDSNTAGRLQVAVYISGALPVFREFHVIENDVYSALLAASATAFDSSGRVNVGKWLGQAVTLSSNNRPDVNVDEWKDVLLSTTNLLPEVVTKAAFADQVWDEAYADHTTAGSFGKLMDILRKSNLVSEGIVAASPTPTATSFGSTLTSADDTWIDHTILFVSGSLAGQSRVISDFANTNGVVSIEEAFTAAPSASDEFVILPDHVHTKASIAETVLAQEGDTGVALTKAIEMIAAALAGKVTASSAAGVTTLTYKKRDGSTTSFTVEVTESDKTRATTGSLS